MKTKKTDCILGADAYAHIVLSGFQTGPSASPMTQSTRLGWVVMDSTCQVNHDCLETTSGLCIKSFFVQQDNRMRLKVSGRSAKFQIKGFWYQTTPSAKSISKKLHSESRVALGFVCLLSPLLYLQDREKLLQNPSLDQNLVWLTTKT